MGSTSSRPPASPSRRPDPAAWRQGPPQRPASQRPTIQADLLLTALGGQGDAIGRLATGEVVLVESGVPGDEVRVALEGLVRGVQRGRILSILVPSVSRVPAPCPVFGRCGGCQWQHIDLAIQRREKTTLAQRALGRNGSEVQVISSVPAYGHRRRVRLHLRRSCGRLQAGMLERASDTLAATSACPVLVPALEALVARLPEVLEPMVEQGEIYAVTGVEGTIATLHARPRADGAGELDVEAAAHALGLAGLSVRLGPLQGTWGRSEVTLPETARTDPSAGRAIPISTDASGFCQATEAGNAAIRAAVAGFLDAIGPVPRCQEFYAGSGNLGSLAVGRTPRLRLVEANADAAARAGRSLATAADLGTAVEVVTGDAALSARAPVPGELWLLDPGRPGARELVERAAAWRPEHFIYVSCAPDTLARDLRRLEGAGYRQAGAALIDTMPHTPHLELVVRLQRP